jgi:putative membrane protein
MSAYPQQSLQKNDKKAGWLIGIFSIVVFGVIAVLSKIQLKADLGFNVHIFAGFNAVINSIVAVLLILALVFVRQKNYLAHKKVMIVAMVLSILFLVSYITHHLLSGDTLYGDSNHDGIVDEAERALVASTRAIYLIILLTHIFLAAIILPFILYTAYRGMTSEFPRHKRLGRITWPIWFYVSVTGPILYWMISPYYQ